jgi:molybdopterin molybdotransferase
MPLSGTPLGPSPLTAGEHSLSVEQARAAIAAVLQPITQTQTLPLMQALGRVLATDLVSPINVPAHDNSAMDGFAFNSADLASAGPTRLRLAGSVMAGAVHQSAVARGECVRIMTGAVMPPGLDCVVPLELCSHDAQLVSIQAGVVRAGDNRRHAGEDLARGQSALRAGRRLTPADLGLVASLGIAELSVFRRLRVALFSTGDELRTLGQTLDEGSVYDSNRYSLMAALQHLRVDVIDLGLVADDPKALRRTLQLAVAQADVVLTSGGVSVGDADHTRSVLAEMGEVAFWKVAMRPGRPFAFGPLTGASAEGDAAKAAPVWLFALPGNPVAALVTFYVFVRQALQQLSGASVTPFVALQARCASAIRKRPGRSEFQRGVVEPAAGGGWSVRLTGSQGAGVLRSMSQANALIVLHHDQGSVAAGDPVEVWLFEGLG